MKPHFHKVPVQQQSSFSVRHDVQPNFGKIWHYHPELELHYVIKGEGVRFIGDNVSNFSAGEIILLGENLPHTWRCKEEYFAPGSALEVQAVVIQFLPECLGRHLLNMPESYLIPRLFEKAKKGILLSGKAREQVAALMLSAVDATNIDRLILLLSIFKILTETEEYSIIASAHAFYKSNESETMRLNKIYSHTLSNYNKPITLKEIASLSNLSVTSFCRYFKLLTRKTYYDFLVEIRISMACRFLVEDRVPINMVCFECGFNNVSNFYRHFKKVTGLTPSGYKRKYLKN
ncbi:MAG: AraC family transcriptional regulator [Williamsia sp.]|nr:AraC family transcriptional regulator [Williamsia sp.]